MYLDGLPLEESKDGTPGIVQRMRDQYRFDANARQYKYRLKSWGIWRYLPSTVKAKAIGALGKRARGTSPSPNIRYKGEEVDKKRLRRHINSHMRSRETLQLGDAVFTQWSLPYKAIRTLDWVFLAMNSPANSQPTPSDLSILSPQQPSPGNASSPTNAPTPTTIAIRTKLRFDRANSLIQGRSVEFLKDLPGPERRVTANWLNQFWLFAFKTTRHWGRGPKRWTPDLLEFTRFVEPVTAPATPAATGQQPGLGPSQGQGLTSDPQTEMAPSRLCRWAIHCCVPQFDAAPSEHSDDSDEVDFDRPESWPYWQQQDGPRGILKHLEDALITNNFSTFQAEDLPLSLDQLVKAARGSEPQLLAEIARFAIMARNAGALEDLLAEEDDMDFSSVHPFHLAASYLDGSRSCCTVVTELCYGLAADQHYINNFEHTVLDSLMITILKGHTACAPSVVDERFRNERQFPGEGVDTCGRWDVDSANIRALHAQGRPKVPSAWKHVFCHTSAQAICHFMTILFSCNDAPNIEMRSGIYTKTCDNCHCKLVLGPLHALVITAFYLAQQGCPDETLFGPLACLVCLVIQGADPQDKAEVSAKKLFGAEDGDDCSHAALDPYLLAAQLPEHVLESWPPGARLGWETLLRVLRFAQVEREHRKQEICSVRRWKRASVYMDYDDPALPSMEQDDLWGEDAEGDSSDDDDSDRCLHDDYNASFGNRDGLGILWAAIQTELSTYRRLEEGDPWLSDRFSMEALREGLEKGVGASFLPLVTQGLMRPFCKCGRFLETACPYLATTEEACTTYFANLEDWSRSTYLQVMRCTY
ncbi:hypothetical protein F4780DRAFT_125516 [Xylariomycetidae sp. FL0641]|nr:hypothetical protein F4780DRAFT_125516 [Xylariomycetidae sp. FL0641]